MVKDKCIGAGGTEGGGLSRCAVVAAGTGRNVRLSLSRIGPGTGVVILLPTSGRSGGTMGPIGGSGSRWVGWFLVGSGTPGRQRGLVERGLRERDGNGKGMEGGKRGAEGGCERNAAGIRGSLGGRRRGRKGSRRDH